jgi:hypothetical protein
MALSVTQINAVAKKYYDEKIRDQAYDDSPFLKVLKTDHKIKERGGTQIQFPINYRKLAQSAATNPRAQVAFQAKDTITGGIDDWAWYRAQVMLPWDDLVKNRGAAEIVNLIKEKTNELKRDLTDALATDLFATSQTTNGLTPLAVIVDSAGAYAGIAVADAATWASTEDNATTTLVMHGSASLSASVMAATRGVNKPTLHVTTRNLWTKYESILQPNQRYEDKKMANLGFDSLTLYSKPVVADSYCTTKYWYGLDMTAFELVCQPGEDYTFTDWFELEQAGFPDSMAKVGKFVGNVVCHCRDTSFKYTLLDYTKA